MPLPSLMLSWSLSSPRLLSVANFCNQKGLLQSRLIRYLLGIRIDRLVQKTVEYANHNLSSSKWLNSKGLQDLDKAFHALLGKQWKVRSSIVQEKWKEIHQQVIQYHPALAGPFDFDPLPPEVKCLIASYLPLKDLINLALANKASQQIAYLLIYPLAQKFGYRGEEEFKNILIYLSDLHHLTQLVKEESSQNLPNPRLSIEDFWSELQQLDPKKCLFLLSILVSNLKGIPPEVKPTVIIEKLSLFLHKSDQKLLRFLLYPFNSEFILHKLIPCTLDNKEDLSVFKFLVEKVGLKQNSISLLFQAIQSVNLKAIHWLIDQGANVKLCYPLPLHYAATLGQIEIAELLIKNGADINDEDQSGETPLDKAISCRHEDMAYWLLNHGADVTKGYPLHQAMNKIWKEMVKFLTDKGCDINGENKSGNTPLDSTIFYRFGTSFQEIQWLIHEGAKAKRSPILHHAIANGKIEEAKLLIDKDAGINDEDKDGLTPLDIAILHNHLDLAQYLLDHGANPAYGYPLHQLPSIEWEEMVELLTKKIGLDINGKDQNGYTPLDKAVYHKNLQVVQYLLDQGADMKKGHPLHHAAAKGQIDMVKLLIDKGCNINGKNEDEYAVTPLDKAIYRKKSEMIQYLLAHGADIKQGYPLHNAVATKQVGLAEQLINQGVGIDSKNRSGFTPLQWAIKNNRKKMARWLIEKGASVNLGYPLHDAITMRQVGVVKLLIDKGAYINSKDKNGSTPLHIATSMGQVEIAELLIKNGAAINDEDQAGETPFDKAIRYQDNIQTFQYLLSKGYDPAHGHPLHQAASSGQIEIANILVKTGVDINSKNNDGLTPLHQAVTDGWKEMAKLLIDNGADINSKDKDGYTPLDKAIYHSPLMIQWLLDHGADIHQGFPLHQAAAKGWKEMVKFLIEERSIDINGKDNDGLTPIDKAICHRHPGMVHWLLNNGANLADGYPLRQAIIAKWEKMADFLINEKGFDVNGKDNQGLTLLEIAISQSFNPKEMVQWLLSKGADPTQGYPLHQPPTEIGWKEAAKLLIERGVDINGKDITGLTPLDKAISNDYLHKALWLLGQGADPTKGHPIHQAASRGWTEMAKLFIERGADINGKDSNGLTPLDMVFDTNPEMAQWLIDRGAQLSNINSSLS